MMARAQEQKSQKRVRWSPDEDKRLAECVDRLDEAGCWADVPRLAGLTRSAKSCRQRWHSNLNPDNKRGPFSEEEEATIIKLQKQLGNKWATIGRQIGRSSTAIKNLWKNHLSKKLPKEETPSLVTQTPWHQLPDTALNDPGDEVPKLHSDASFSLNPRHGHGFHPTDAELILTSLPPQTPSYHYEDIPLASDFSDFPPEDISIDSIFN